MKLKKLGSILLSLALLFSLTGCENSSSNDKSTVAKQENTKPLSSEEFKQMYSDPNKFKGRTVDFYAKIFIAPEKDDKGTYFQCYANNDDSLNTFVGILDPKLDVKEGEVVRIIGNVKEKMKGTNAFGGEVSAPLIQANKVEKTDYATAFSPAIKTIELNKEINQHGYVIKLNKVEIAKEETRAYITVTNNSKGKINFYSFNSKAVQGSKQLDIKDNYEAKYPEIKSEILSGVKEEGIVTFQPIDVNGDKLRIIFEGSSDNYSLQFNPFEYEINIK
ncbi:MAG: DUF4352 domain-containing protein [Clostridium lundense]|nr:DUF4352 domain-containing protein [Clostridium lundense]